MMSSREHSAAHLLKIMLSQDPEIMAEAKKMMENPEFQNQMKKMSETKDFKENIHRTTEMMKDPSKSAQVEAKMEHMLMRGEDDLKKAAGGMMEEAMAAMNNPDVMAEMGKMMKDPNFQQQLQAMAKDPSFKSYTDAVSTLFNSQETSVDKRDDTKSGGSRILLLTVFYSAAHVL
jgi:DNA repair ATPase RecN